MPALSFSTIEQSGYLKYDSNQYIEKWCEMENMKFMETGEDNGYKIQGFGIRQYYEKGQMDSRVCSFLSHMGADERR